MWPKVVFELITSITAVDQVLKIISATESTRLEMVDFKLASCFIFMNAAVATAKVKTLSNLFSDFV